jgi:hypothetical protein
VVARNEKSREGTYENKQMVGMRGARVMRCKAVLVLVLWAAETIISHSNSDSQSPRVG